MAEKAEDIVINGLQELFPSKIELFRENLYDKPINKEPFNFNSIDLVYIYTMIETKLGYKLLLKYNTDFSTINSIILFVNKKLKLIDKNSN